MARFPNREAELKVLAQNMVTGLVENAGIFPAPPVTSAELQGALDAFIAVGDEVVAARAAAEVATVAKNARLEELKAVLKSNLRYAETTAKKDDATLSLLGWGARSARTPLQPPGQPGTLRIPHQGEDGVTLAWNAPDEGGKVASYKIECRERPSGTWTLIDIALTTEVPLPNQERGKDFEYRIIAVNKAGEGMPSNTVAAVV